VTAGTGNVLPFRYGPGGTKQTWTVMPKNSQIAAPPIGHGLYNYAAPATEPTRNHHR